MTTMVERYLRAVEAAGCPDTQCFAYYDWEDGRLPLKRLHEQHLTWEQCKQMVKRVWARYSHTKPPRLKAIRSDASASAANREHLLIPEYMRNTSTILHEITHSVMYLKWPKSYRTDAGVFEGHGPEFARLHADIVSQETGIPLSEIMGSMRRNGIAVGRRSEIPRPLGDKR